MLAQTWPSLPGQAYLLGELSYGGSSWGETPQPRKEGVLWDQPTCLLMPGAKAARGRRGEPCHVAWLLCLCRRWCDGGDVTSPSSTVVLIPGWSQAGKPQLFYKTESEN